MGVEVSSYHYLFGGEVFAVEVIFAYVFFLLPHCAWPIYIDKAYTVHCDVEPFGDFPLRERVDLGWMFVTHQCYYPASMCFTGFFGTAFRSFAGVAAVAVDLERIGLSARLQFLEHDNVVLLLGYVPPYFSSLSVGESVDVPTETSQRTRIRMYPCYHK